MFAQRAWSWVPFSFLFFVSTTNMKQTRRFHIYAHMSTSCAVSTLHYRPCVNLYILLYDSTTHMKHTRPFHLYAQMCTSCAVSRLHCRLCVSFSFFTLCFDSKHDAYKAFSHIHTNIYPVCCIFFISFLSLYI
jgi:hypothetical protein